MGKHRWPTSGDSRAVDGGGRSRRAGTWGEQAARDGASGGAAAPDLDAVGDPERDGPSLEGAPFDRSFSDGFSSESSASGGSSFDVSSFEGDELVQPRVRWGIARSAALVFLGVALAVGAALFLVRSSEPSAAAVSVQLDAPAQGAASADDDPPGPASDDAGVSSSGASSETDHGASGPPGTAPNGSGETGSGTSSAETGSGAGDLVVYVTGAVATPGVVTVPVGTRLFAVLEQSGGPLPEADLEGINLAGLPADGQHIHVLAVGEQPRAGNGSLPGSAPPVAEAGSASGASESGADRGADATTGGSPAGGVLDINTATLAEIEGLPRVGPVLGQRIIDWRETQGPFAQPADIDAVPGIGPALLEGILPLIRAG